ncbi:hypothetical protein LZC95_48665 [Pendulispora brunnea]|uniref:Uncharacterized protein n=1 Tax=Pendulispora brunnea TaxID=2905690 RepID=A0ABZ2K6J4_9BACT
MSTSSSNSPSKDVVVMLGATDGEHLAVRARRRSHADCADYWDGNWLDCAIEVCAGGFRGSMNADLRAEEFVEFRDALGALHRRLAGTATFQTMERWLTIKVVGDGRGHFEADCELRDAPGTGNRLHCTLGFDQTELPLMLRGLDAIVDAFPVVGRP